MLFFITKKVFGWNRVAKQEPDWMQWTQDSTTVPAPAFGKSNPTKSINRYLNLTLVVRLFDNWSLMWTRFIRLLNYFKKSLIKLHSFAFRQCNIYLSTLFIYISRMHGSCFPHPILLLSSLKINLLVQSYLIHFYNDLTF